MKSQLRSSIALLLMLQTLCFTPAPQLIGTSALSFKEKLLTLKMLLLLLDASSFHLSNICVMRCGRVNLIAIDLQILGALCENHRQQRSGTACSQALQLCASLSGWSWKGHL
jgi:hypothetical protein